MTEKQVEYKINLIENTMDYLRAEIKNILERLTRECKNLNTKLAVELTNELEKNTYENLKSLPLNKLIDLTNRKIIINKIDNNLNVLYERLINDENTEIKEVENIKQDKMMTVKIDSQTLEAWKEKYPNIPRSIFIKACMKKALDNDNFLKEIIFKET